MTFGCKFLAYGRFHTASFGNTMKIPVSLTRIAWLGAALALSAQLLGAEASKAEVTAVRGTASINGTAAKKGDTASTGAQIATGASSELSLYLDLNGPVLVVGADSKLTFEELTADTSGPEAIITTKVKLDEGRVSGFVKKTSDQSSYQVSTPTITAAIRGTKYLVTADGFVYVWEGCVDVTYNGEFASDAERQRIGNHFQVCAGQAFDPRIPGIIVNPLPEPPVGTSGKVIVPPVGPERPVSPVQPFGRTASGSGSGTGGTEQPGD